MNRLTGIALGVVVLLLIGGGAFYFFRSKPLPGAPTNSLLKPNTEKEDAQKATQIQQQLAATTVILQTLNNSGESGIASFRDNNGKLEVSIDLTAGFPKDTPQPAHIHVGNCPGVGEIKYPLSDIVNGKSVTTLDTTLDALKQELPLAINVHKSKTEMSNYVTCGEVGENPNASS